MNLGVALKESLDKVELNCPVSKCLAQGVLVCCLSLVIFNLPLVHVTSVVIWNGVASDVYHLCRLFLYSRAIDWLGNDFEDTFVAYTNSF